MKRTFRTRSAIISLACLPMIAWFTTTDAHAADPIAEHSLRNWTQRDGLPSNEINGLIQDHTGSLIVATTDGMVLFDGRSFTRILNTSGVTRRQRGFVTLVETPAGGEFLVAPRSGGLIQMTRDTSTVRPLPEDLAGAQVEALLYEDARTVWIGFKGGMILRDGPDGLQHIDTQDAPGASGPIQFALDQEGRVWVARGSFLARHERDALVYVPIGHGTEQLRIATARQGGPWLLADEHLGKFTDGRFQELDKVNGNMAAYFTQALMEDSSGYLWFGTRSRGLRRWRSDGDVRRIVEVPEDITTVIEDHLGNIWAGSNGGGLIRVKPGMLKIYNRSVGLLENQSLAVCQDGPGRMWFANRDGGLAWLNENGRTPVVEKPGPWDRFSVLSVAPMASRRIWASTTNGLLSISGKGIVGQIDDPDLAGRKAPDVMFASSEGDLWVALHPTGAARISDGAVAKIRETHGLEPTAIRVFAEDPQGRIWAGCENGTIQVYDGSRFSRLRRFEGEDTGPVHAIHFDSDGICWIGTERGGLIRLSETGRQALTADDGLISDNITQIVSDDNGVLWLGSPAGIFHLGPGEIEAFLAGASHRVWPIVIGPDEGLEASNCIGNHQPAVWKSDDGILWFATRQGVVAIDPKREAAARTSLDTTILAVHADGEILEPEGLLRIPSSARNVEITYSVLCLATPEHAHSSYRLEGYDETWIGDNGGVARYSRLAPGRYRFEVSSLVAGRPELRSNATIEIEIVAAWWQTLWFIAAASATGVIGLVLAVRHGSHLRLKKKLARLERDSTLERERTRIAQDIHDDLGAGLTRISLLTQSALEGAGQPQLDKIYHAVGELTQSMDEIVWAVNPKNDNLENVAGYVGEFAQGYLTDVGLRCRVLIPEVLPDRPISAQFRHHLFLACKEALNNVVKHARATSVTVEFAIERETVLVRIVDDGIGITRHSEPSATQNGLRNMLARMEAIGGSFLVAPAEPTGTIVVLTASLTTPIAPS